MVFSSILFLSIFLPTFLIAYQFTPQRLKNILILIGSIFFYAWGAPRFILIVVFSLIANFYIVKYLFQSEKNKKLLLICSIAINLGLLAYFKYVNFFIDNLNFILSSINANELSWTKVALPIGISFFTFQSLTYTVDVYRNVHKPLEKLSDYLLYILMFPQLIAGPIVRFNTIADEITNRKANETIDNKLFGAYRFIIGLSKKVLIANVLGEQVGDILALPIEDNNTALAWLSIVTYSFQIYFDFSGYSDMAIGLGKIMGFNFPENFNNPYVSKNISEFWKRWHITLGTWMKDYLYIPLGGNRVGSPLRLYANLIIVFLLSGLWHGASWNYVIWGAWHGMFLILDRLFLVKLLNKTGKLPSILITYFVVLIGWVFFKIEDLGYSFQYIKLMFSFNFDSISFELPNLFITILILATIFSFITTFKAGRKLEYFLYYSNAPIYKHIVFCGLSVYFLITCISFITASSFNPFIYFRF